VGVSWRWYAGSGYMARSTVRPLLPCSALEFGQDLGRIAGGLGPTGSPQGREVLFWPSRIDRFRSVDADEAHGLGAPADLHFDRVAIDNPDNPTELSGVDECR